MVTLNHLIIRSVCLDGFDEVVSQAWLAAFGEGDVELVWTRELQAMWMGDVALRRALGLLLHFGVLPTWPMTNLDARYCDLALGDFRGMRLSGARFAEADLRGVSFYGADLRQADFRHADLRDVDLRDADLFGARFEGALVDGTIGLPAKYVMDTAGVAMVAH